MFIKDMHVGWLLDFYGEVLPEKTYEMLKQYYEDDLSLAEIADAANMTRQGVRHFIKKGEEELLHLEECLGLAARFRVLEGLADRILEETARLGSIDHPTVKEVSSAIDAYAKEMKTRL